MQRRAFCPVCEYSVPRLWFTKRRFRPCPGCFTHIKAIEKYDRFWSVLIGAVTSAIGMPLIIIAAILAGEKYFAALAIAILLTLPIGSALGFFFFPYFAPFEADTFAGPGCPRCGYDLRVSPQRCPECGTEPLRACNVGG